MMDIQVTIRKAQVVSWRMTEAKRIVGGKCETGGVCGTWSAGECSHCRKIRHTFARLNHSKWLPDLPEPVAVEPTRHAVDRIASGDLVPRNV